MEIEILQTTVSENDLSMGDWVLIINTLHLGSG